MNHSWLKNVIPIAAIFSFRMLGLFMLIPVFTVYANTLQGATPALMGIALGSYGLSQGILQIPFGMLSDRFGRKPIISIGLILFVLGSLLGAFSHSIYTMILARTLQGTGAIGSVLIALLADLTPDNQRTKAMAVIGMTIGLSFSLAMVLSPLLSSYYGLAGIFYFTAFLAFLGLLLLHLVIPTPKREYFHQDSSASLPLFKTVLANRHLQRLNIGIFLQHFILTATFYVIPILLQQQMKQAHLSSQWHFYLPLMLVSFVCMIPFIIIAEKKHHMKGVFILSLLLTSLAQLGLAFSHPHWLALCLLMFGYFVAFNILEALLPSLISKQAGPARKGTAMGIYSSSQFLGIFVGGALAGVLYQFAGSVGVFVCNGLLALLWMGIAFYMRPDLYLTTLILSYTENPKECVQKQLEQLAGIKEIVIAPEEKVIYLLIDKANYLPGSAEKIVQNLH
ncbi:MAG: MFS transporter [Tatlockia sp.]|jgi:MFS family permease